MSDMKPIMGKAVKEIAKELSGKQIFECTTSEELQPLQSAVEAVKQVDHNVTATIPATAIKQFMDDLEGVFSKFKQQYAAVLSGGPLNNVTTDAADTTEAKVVPAPLMTLELPSLYIPALDKAAASRKVLQPAKAKEFTDVTIPESESEFEQMSKKKNVAAPTAATPARKPAKAIKKVEVESESESDSDSEDDSSDSSDSDDSSDSSDSSHTMVN